MLHHIRTYLRNSIDVRLVESTGLFPCGFRNVSCTPDTCDETYQIDSGTLVNNNVLQTLIDGSGSSATTSSASEGVTPTQITTTVTVTQSAATITASTAAEPGGSKISIGAAAGVGVGAGIGTMLLLGVAAWLLFRKNATNPTRRAEPTPSTFYTQMQKSQEGHAQRLGVPEMP
jgi:hypothetical protein